MEERHDNHTDFINPDFREHLRAVERFAKSNSRYRKGDAIAQALCGKAKLDYNDDDGGEKAKTAILTSDFNATYDIPVDQEDGYWDKIIDYSAGLANVGVRFTNRNKVLLSELTLGTNGEDVWRPGVENTDPGDTVTADTAEVTFTLEEVIAILSISDHTLEDQLEGGGLEAHLMRMIQATAGNEWEKAAFNGTKVGTANSSRGSITGCFDGFVQLANAGGNVINAADYNDRYVDVAGETSNDKHMAALKTIPEKYGTGNLVIMSPRTLIIDAANQLGVARLTPLGDEGVRRGYRGMGVNYPLPWFNVPHMRTNYIVKGTGTKAATTPGDTTLNGITKARATTSTVAAIANFGNNAKTVIGAGASAGTTYNLNAEYRLQSGTPSGTTLTWATATTYDHADAEYVVEYDVAPTLTGIANLITSWDNLGIASQRLMRIEPYRLPRSRRTDFVITARWCPVMYNPDASVLIRDLAKK